MYAISQIRLGVLWLTAGHVAKYDLCLLYGTYKPHNWLHFQEGKMTTSFWLLQVQTQSWERYIHVFKDICMWTNIIDRS